MTTMENRQNNAKRIIFFDSTLRDGEQAPGAGMTLEQKVDTARHLAKMGVDVIEAGFANSSPEDFEALQIIARDIATPRTKVCSLARCHPADIRAAADAIIPAIVKKAGRIHVFVAASDKHMKTKLGKTRAEVLEMIEKGVTYARRFCPDVEFSAEDAFNADRSFLVQCVQTAIRCGATTINLPDTIGEAVHLQYYDFVKEIIERVKAPQNVVYSVHCHNDKGLATANSLFGLSAGACQVECCMNGIGERAGNAALEEIAMAVKSSPNVYPFTFRLDTHQIKEVSEVVEKYTGFQTANCKAVVGRTAYSHGSGIHQDGVIKAWEKGVSCIYGAVDPKEAGYRESIVITRHSGIRAVTYMLQQQGIKASPEEAQALLEIVKKGKEKIVSPAQLRAYYQQQKQSGKEKVATQNNLNKSGFSVYHIRQRGA